jgi:hypothetical protein
MIACINVQSQGIVLNAGDTYTYQFSTLLLQGVVAIPPNPPGVPAGMIQGAFALGSFQPGSTLLCEMFEDSTAQAPIASQTLIYPEGYSPPPGPVFWSVGAWQDLQGAIRFTMVSGSVTISEFTVSATLNEIGGLTEYSTTVVPEPKPLPLLCALIGIAFVCRAQKHRHVLHKKN